jgi:hypothetical protein
MSLSDTCPDNRELPSFAPYPSKILPWRGPEYNIRGKVVASPIKN